MPNSEQRVCQNCKASFEIDASDFDFYEKIKVPAPTFCPECRLIRRLAWRNEKSFYKRNCDKCRKPMISVFAPSTGLKVYCSACWWSDTWDGLDYGVDFDPQKPFLQQLRELLQRVPMMNLYGLYTTVINSDYNNLVGHLKDCYMVTSSDHGENLCYGSIVQNSSDSVDNLMINRCQLCHESVNCQDCYKTFFSGDCEACREVFFCKDCLNCQDCFGCCNLRNKQYYFFNQPLSKEQYNQAVAKYNLASFNQLILAKQFTEEHWLKFPVKYFHGRHNVNSSGDYLFNTKNTQHSFIANNIEDSKFCSFVDVTPANMSESYDFTSYGSSSSLLYEALQTGDQVARIKIGWFVITNSLDIEYSMFQVGCKNTFGCVGLKKKQHYILNKQYSENDYKKLKEKVIEQMNSMPYVDKKGRAYKYGEFFPIELSPFGYNETSAQEYLPLSKAEAELNGYSWRDPEPRNYQINIKSQDLPDNIKDVKDDILNQVIECQHQSKCNEHPTQEQALCRVGCTEAFKIIEPELAFYRRMNLPLPRLCPNCRHYGRLKQRNPLKLWTRQCMCSGKTSQAPQGLPLGAYVNTAKHEHGDNPCPNTFQTSYAPDRPEIVYCEACYLKEVV
jgi:hypothetical protein